MVYEQIVEKIEDRWTTLQSSIEQLCEELGREIPTTVAVTKTRTLEEVQAAIDIGIKDFGENYAQEFERKAKEFPDLNWHYIGHLQRGNADSVVPYATIIHTLDRKKLTNRLLYLEYENDNFIQVNISGEDSKYGIDYNIETVRDLLEYSRKEGLTVTGLMSIGNLNWDTTLTEREYKKFREFTNELGLKNLSLGMSGDWQSAIKAGSTHLRIGTAIFGPR